MKEEFPKIIREVVWLFRVIATFAIILLLTVVVADIAGVAISFITTEPNWPIVLLSVIVVISILVTELLKYNDETNNKH